MNEEAYITNVIVLFSMYLVGAIGVYLTLTLAYMGFKSMDRVLYNQYRRRLKSGRRIVVFGILVIGVFFSLTSPSNIVWQHDDKDVTAREIQSWGQNGGVTSPPPPKIVDESRQPKHTEAERQDHFDELIDWRSRK